MRIRSIISTTLACVALLPGLTLGSEVFRYVDKDGVVHYTDKPDGKKAEKADLPPLQVISPFEAPESVSASAKDSGQKRNVPANPTVEVVYPTPDETFRHANAAIPIRLSLSKPLPEGFGLKYLVDGSSQNSEPVREFEFTVSGIERGQHLISAAIVDRRGREVSRATPVIIHMKPPTVRRN